MIIRLSFIKEVVCLVCLITETLQITHFFVRPSIYSLTGYEIRKMVIKNQIFADLVKAGVCGFKCFLIHSGVDEFKSVTRDEAARALEELKVLKIVSKWLVTKFVYILQDTGSVLLFHAEVEVPQETGDNFSISYKYYSRQFFLAGLENWKNPFVSKRKLNLKQRFSLWKEVQSF